jgi:hypothetical protein
MPKLEPEFLRGPEDSGFTATGGVLRLVSRQHAALISDKLLGSPVSHELDTRASEELSAAVRMIAVGSMLNLCLPGRLRLGLRRQRCFIAVSPATGDVIWTKKPLSLSGRASEPNVPTFEAQVGKFAKSAYKRERLVGVVPQAAHVPGGAECSFILALERRQLVLVADDLAIKQAWVAACFAVLERRGSAIAIAADVAAAAAIKDAQAAKDAAEMKREEAAAQALAAASSFRAEMETVRAQAQAEARAVEAAAQAKAEEVARAALEEEARAKAVADATIAAAVLDAQTAKLAASEDLTAKNEAATQALAVASSLKAEAEAVRTQAQAEARAVEAAAQAKAEEAARGAQEEAARAVAVAEATIAAAVLDAETAKLAAAKDLAAKAEAARLKAAIDLKADMERGRAQFDMQIAACGGVGLQLAEERTCIICYDNFRGYNEGVACDGSQPHFVCNECFAASVNSSVSDELGKQDLRGGRLACPLKTFPCTEGSCNSSCYDDRVVAKKVDAPTFEAYLQVRNKLLEAKLSRDADVEMERKIAAAVKQMEAEGVKVFQTQKYIVDDILTMRCPRCKMAFADWDGCNALYCTYAGCGCNFCAFCLKDCGGGVQHGQKEIVRRGDDEVHKHVNECKYAQGIGHGNDGRVQSQVWSQIRKDRIEECLKEMCETVEERQKVVDNLKQQFDALGLKIELPGGRSTRPTSSVDIPSTVRHQVLLPDDMDELPNNIKRCPACGILIEKVDGNEEVMCGCEAKPAGGTYEKALKGGGCGHMFNFVTLAPMGVGKAGEPANERQVHFR